MNLKLSFRMKMLSSAVRLLRAATASAESSGAAVWGSMSNATRRVVPGAPAFAALIFLLPLATAVAENIEQYRTKLPDGRLAYLFDDVIYDEPPLPGETWITGDSWTNSVVYYIFDASVSQAYRQLFTVATARWSEVSALQFVELAGANHIRVFEADLLGCGSAQVGMVGGEQVLLLDPLPQCMNVGTILHELGHSLGMSHEHQRLDRNSFINLIDEDNMAGDCPTAFGVNYGAMNGTPMAPYDFASVMHYPYWTRPVCGGVPRDIYFVPLSVQPPGPPEGSELACTSLPSCQEVMGSDELSARDGYTAASQYGYRLDLARMGVPATSIQVSGAYSTCLNVADCYVVIPGQTVTISASSPNSDPIFVNGPCLGRGSCSFEMRRNTRAVVRAVPASLFTGVDADFVVGHLFVDGFETQDSSRWSVTTP